MPQLSPEKKLAVRSQLGAFAGFATPTSNTTYTPNQFFDVCLRHCSRGAVRLVAYLLRQTLGWCDGNGNPLHERLKVSYSEFVQKAGVSRGVIRKSLDEALRGGFIECVQTGKASTAHSKGESAHYQLRWDSRSEYIKDPEKFCGFFEGEGNRTDIPNQFFDRVIRDETLAVDKVVGSIIRFSIGFQARHGRRRQQVALSYRDIQRYGRTNDSHTLAEAIRHAEASNYIVRLEAGVFDPNAGQNSRPAVFTLKWADASPFFSTGSKTPAALLEADRFKNPSGTGSESPAENRFKNPSDIETKLTKEISKQQQTEAETPEALLREEGFTQQAARTLAAQHSREEVRRQVEWLPHRSPSHNRLGMLRRAIEENWPGPEKLRISEVSDERLFAQHFYAGLAGNPDLPVAEPSIRDTEFGAQFIQRLIASNPTEVDVPAWARQFAAYVKERKHERDIPSLVLALRSHGDAWLLRFRAAQERARHEALEGRRTVHRKLHEHEWFGFLADAENTCRTHRAEEYAAFVQQCARNRWTSSSATPEQARLLAFARHFDLPDFWQWDAEFNPQPFEPCK